MKLIKYLFFLLLIVAIGGAVYFGTKDGKFDASVTKNIEAPASIIFQNVEDFKEWKDWEPWSKEDPGMVVRYADKTAGVGGSYSWESETMGNGSMETVNVSAMDSIAQKITFNTPMGDSKSDVYWYFVPTETGTAVTWGMKGEHSFMEKVYMAFQSEDFETSLRKMFGNGLDNLAANVAEEMNLHTITVEGLKEYGGGYYMYTTAASTQNDIGQKMAPMMGKVTGFMNRNNIAMAGMPFTIYNEWDTLNGSVIFSAAVPVKERIIVTEGDVLCGYMEPLTAVKTTLLGNYTHLGKAYTQAQEYVAQNGLVIDPKHQMFEVYANDPSTVPNPADWKTEIYIPVIKAMN